MSRVIPQSRTAGAAQGLTIVAAGFLIVLTVIALPPALPRIMAFFHSTPNAEVLTPLIVTAPSLAIALLSPLAGWVADRYGKRRPLLIACALFLVFGAMPAMLNDLNLIVLSRIGVGASVTFIAVITAAMLADYFPEEQRRTWLTAQGLGLPLLAAVGFVAAGALAGVDWHYAFLLYGVTIPIFIAVFLFCYEPAPRTHTESQTAASTRFPWRPAICVCVVSWVIALFFYIFIIHSGLAFAAIGVESGAQLGGIIGAVSLTSIFGALLFNYLARHIAAEMISAIQIAIMGIGLVGIGLAADLTTMIAFAVVQQIGAGMMVPTTIFWMSQILPPEHRGRGFGILTTVGCIGQFMAPFIVTLASTLCGGLQPGLAALGAVAVASAVVLPLWSRSQMPRVAAEPVT